MALVDEIIGGETPRTKGRASKHISAVKARDLTSADLALLEVEGNRTTSAPKPIAKIKNSHHALAKALAGGMKDVEASIVTGYDPSRISILKGDPSFKALIDFYRDNLNAVFADLHQRMSGLSIEAADRLREMLEDDENKVSATVLLDILKTTADRTGYAPTMKAEIKTLHLTPEDLTRLNNETNETNRVSIVGTAGDKRPAISVARDDKSVEEDKAEGKSGCGEIV